MKSAPPDYYTILGLSPEATSDEIKKRYRELARRYHPDVNASPEAAQKIKVINEAHHVLGDPERRATYDAERILRQPASPPPSSDPTASSASARTAARPSAARPTTPPSQPPPRASRVEFNGFGRVPSEPPHAESAPWRPAPPPPKDAAAKAAEAVALAKTKVEEAQVSFLTRNYADAERLCREALEAYPRNAVAHEILGDIYAIKGEHERA